MNMRKRIWTATAKKDIQMTIDEFFKTGGKIIPHTVYQIRDKNGIDLTTDFWSGQTHWLNMLTYRTQQKIIN